MSTHKIFITGGTGYVGQKLIIELLARGYEVQALVRPGSENKLHNGVTAITGDALDAESFASSVPPADTLIHLVGTPKPNPYKGKQFRNIDLPSIKAAVSAAVQSSIQHMIYISIAHPAPIMRDYIAVRKEGEVLIRNAGLNATIIRPWYILGPGHWWPYVLIPFYAIGRKLTMTREAANRLGLVTRQQMIESLVRAVENPPEGIRIIEVSEIQMRSK